MIGIRWSARCCTVAGTILGLGLGACSDGSAPPDDTIPGAEAADIATRSPTKGSRLPSPPSRSRRCPTAPLRKAARLPGAAGRSRTFTVSTVAHLVWGASCTTERKIASGGIHLNSRERRLCAGGVERLWGENPERSFVG